MGNPKWLATAVLVSLTGSAYAQLDDLVNCKEQEAGKIRVAKIGHISEYQCKEGSVNFTKYVLNNLTILISGEGTITYVADNATKATAYSDGTLFIFQGRTENRDCRRCPACLYLVDLTNGKPHVFAFGIQNASNEYHWASWGKKRSVIAIKRNVKFVYENGKLTPPKKDNDLFLAIKPTMFETPVEKLDPFVDELPVK